MRDYLIRRFLLIIPTLIGATFVVFGITRFVPGSPAERRMQEAMAKSDQSRSQNADAGGALSEEQKLQLLEGYGLDKPIPVAYLQWLGAMPREESKQRVTFPDPAVAADPSDGAEGETDTAAEGEAATPAAAEPAAAKGAEARLTLKELLPEGERTEENWFRLTEVKVIWDGKDDVRLEPVEGEGDAIDLSKWHAVLEWPKREIELASGEKVEVEDHSKPPRAAVFTHKFNGLLQGSLGYSLRYNDPIGEMIVQRFPVSLFYGILTLIIVYGVCIPLGVVKAIKHRTAIDTGSSVLVFLGYAIPGYALGSILVVFLAARWGWFPTGGFVSDGFSELSLLGKIWDLIHHAVLPLICYVIGSFAFLTLLMKNNLLDNLAADYVRTAVAKGVNFRGAVIKHAFRNSLIPIATTFGQNIMLLVAGSILIERLFDIEGFGLLSYEALVNRDFTVFMGISVISSALLMIGNILSDILVAALNPRIRFQ
ncbi:MAG: ABC transporter permease [Verrucomicrobiales bacterium]